MDTKQKYNTPGTTCDLVHYLAGHKLPAHVCIAYGELIHRCCFAMKADPMLMIAIVDKMTQWDDKARRGRGRGMFLLRGAPSNPYEQIWHGVSTIAQDMALKNDFRKTLKELRYDWRDIGLHWKQIDMQINQVCKGVIPMEPMRCK